MSEDKTNLFDADSTNPLPIEQFIRQHIAMLVRQGDELRERQVKLEEQQNALREEMLGRFEQLSEEMTRRFEQLSQQNLRLEDLGRKIREEIRDLDYKVGPFIPEVLPDGRLRLREVWQWTSGDLSQGESVVEEVRA